MPNTVMTADNRKYRSKEEEDHWEDQTLKTRETSLEPISINRKSLSWIMLNSLVVSIDKLLKNHHSSS
jgi:hypothetical protein